MTPFFLFCFVPLSVSAACFLPWQTPCMRNRWLKLPQPPECLQPPGPPAHKLLLRLLMGLDALELGLHTWSSQNHTHTHRIPNCQLLCYPVHMTSMWQEEINGLLRIEIMEGTVTWSSFKPLPITILLRAGRKESNVMNKFWYSKLTTLSLALVQ